jgi:polyhydroxyalkanoate synthesis regulator phasin
MKNYKKVAAVVITAVAITGSASALASASSTKSKSINSANMAKNGIGKPDRGFAPSNKEAIITSTLGIDATTLRNRIEAGETLAAIAGAKKDALIAALVADETKQIDAAVAAGKLTAEKAATLKSNLTAHVTEEVNAVRGPGMGGKGGPRMDGPRGGFGPGDMETVITSTLGIDATTLRNRLTAGETLAAIAGAKKDALIAALVTEMTKRIDADLAAGKLTADQAKSLKDGLTAHVTEEVNEVHGPGMGGKGGRGGHGHGHGPGDGNGDHGNGMGLPNGSTNGIPNTSNSNN